MDTLADGATERDKIAPDIVDKFDAIFMSSLMFEVGFAFCAVDQEEVEDNIRKVNTVYLHSCDAIRIAKQEEVEMTFKTKVKESGFKFGYNSRRTWRWEKGYVTNELAVCL